MRVAYRYEKDGIGPYMGYPQRVGDRLRAHHTGSFKHPGPITDFGHSMRSEDCCGCSSLTQLLTWFKGFNSMLYREGFEIVEYHAVITSEGTYQVSIGGERHVVNVFESVADARRRAEVV